MNSKKGGIWVVVFLMITFWEPTLGYEDSWEYGKKCYQELGVELPAINCNQGATVPVTGASDGNCHRPSFGVARCNKGSRVLQFTDKFKRTPNGREEKVVTTVQCRKGSGDNYELAVIQHNETNNKSCWWFPGYRTTLPKPYDANLETQGGPNLTRFKNDSKKRWGNTLETQDCIRCHTSGVYIRSPWIMQMDGSEEGSFTRDGRTGEYSRGGRIRFTSTIARRGFSCAVEPGQEYPKLVKISGAAFDSHSYNENNPRPPDTAPSDTCTRCHYMGFGGSVCSMSESALGEHVTNSTLKYPENRWMPPQSEWPDRLIPKSDASDQEKANLEKEFLKYYKPAIDAVMFCCDSNNQGKKAKVNGIPENICEGGRLFDESPNPSRPCLGGTSVSPNTNPSERPSH